MGRSKGKAFKVLRTAGIIFILLLAVGYFFLTRGLSEMQELTVNEVNLAEKSDGSYTGEFNRYRWSETVDVTVEGQQIVQIQPSDKQRHHDELINRIIEEQALRVDVVSGATVSSNAFLKAVENALLGP